MNTENPARSDPLLVLTEIDRLRKRHYPLVTPPLAAPRLSAGVPLQGRPDQQTAHTPPKD
ncbi:hypothetical protein SSPS47_27045 [Streptomyces sp. S4.7]|nr:hypothetical protein SSPS47_27045 [Streptomyces sp. S4.7]